MGAHRLIIDPMLSSAGAMPGFKIFGGGRKNNPLVELPANTDDLLRNATGVIITHEHPDHIDQPGLDWIRKRNLPVWASRIDAPSLEKKSLSIRRLEDGVEGIQVEVVPAQHGRGVLGWLMGHVSGLYLAPNGGPSILLTSDAIWTPQLDATLRRLQPSYTVAPAGSANVGLGGDILFSVDELIELTRATSGKVIFNHLEALDHCPTTRSGLKQRLESEGLLDRCIVPEDGTSVVLEPNEQPVVKPAGNPVRMPDLRKWVTAQMS
ncbi:MAG: MBL fold metallo-hydrolase, partial [Myxococcota bacterium]